MADTCLMKEIDLKQVYKMLTRENLTDHVDPKTFCDYLVQNLEVEDEFAGYFEGYHIVKVFGKGAYGVVFQMCKNDNPFECRALKMQVLDEDAEEDEVDELVKEKDIQFALAQKGIAPEIEQESRLGILKVYKQFDPTKNFVEVNVLLFRMMPIKTTVRNILTSGTYTVANFAGFMRRFLKMIKAKTLAKVIHGDMHINNVATDQKGDIVMIDFGFARQEPRITGMGFLDFIPFIGSIVALSNDEPPQRKDLLWFIAQLLMVACNYIFGSQFKALKYFVRKQRGGYEYNTGTFSMDSYDKDAPESFVKLRGGITVALDDIQWTTVKKPTEKSFDFLMEQDSKQWVQLYSFLTANHKIEI